MYADLRDKVVLVTGSSRGIGAAIAGIRVNCIAPETILTERNQQLIPKRRLGR